MVSHPQPTSPLIEEVLSPSTEGRDRGRRWHRHRRSSSLHDYRLFAQDQPRVERYSRQEDSWRFTEITAGTVQLDSIGRTLPRSEIYDEAPRAGPRGSGARGRASPRRSSTATEGRHRLRTGLQ